MLLKFPVKAVIASLVIVVALSACGRKGALEVPGAYENTVQSEESKPKKKGENFILDGLID